MPIWFDEGLATVVDHRYIRNDNLSLDNLNDLSSRQAFYDSSRVKINYEIAHSEIMRWLETVGESGLLELIEGLNQGETFYVLYKAIESRS